MQAQIMQNEEKRIVRALLKLNDQIDLNLWKEPQEKNLAESNKVRKWGNDLYAEHKHDLRSHIKILEHYNRSIAFALNGSQELILSYGNRSALLAHLKRYQESIEDIDRAINLSPPIANVIKYLIRKVECQVELGLQEAYDTCHSTKSLLQEVTATAEWKKNNLSKLVKAMIKLERNDQELRDPKPIFKLPNEEPLKKCRCPEYPEASSAVQIHRDPQKFRLGRHIITTCEVQPGQALYRGKHYVVFPMEKRVYTNCSHCLNFAWNGIPCPGCVYAIYCSEQCKEEAWERYHDVECKVAIRLLRWSETNNTGRLMSIRLLVMAMKEAGSLQRLKEEFQEIDQCQDLRKKGFSENQTVFSKNYRAVYSLRNNMFRKELEELVFISRDSAQVLHLLAKYTTMFKKYFDSNLKDLARNEDALFIAKTLSHYQHLVISNAMTVKDTYSAAATDWNWVDSEEGDFTGLCLTPFLSLLNHSCVPNVTRIETKDRQTILFAIRPIAKGGQLYDCYGPTFADLMTEQRQALLAERFYFTCNCIACEFHWPLYKILTNQGIEYQQKLRLAIEGTQKALAKCDEIFKSLKDGSFVPNVDVIYEVAYSIILTIRHSKMPNWRLPYLVNLLISVLNEMYGYLVNVPEKC